MVHFPGSDVTLQNISSYPVVFWFRISKLYMRNRIEVYFMTEMKKNVIIIIEKRDLNKGLQ